MMGPQEAQHSVSGFLRAYEEKVQLLTDWHSPLSASAAWL